MTNDQAPMTKQIQSTNEKGSKQAVHCFNHYHIGYSCLFGHWSLVLGHWHDWSLTIGTEI
jgi:hypothetical protein